MEKINIDKVNKFYGRSIGYDGNYHIVQSSNPLCTNLDDIDSCCGTTKYRIIREEWDHYNTGIWCDDNHADDEILEFVARRGFSSNTKNKWQDELKTDYRYPRLNKEYWAYVSAIDESVTSIKLCTGECYDLPHDAILEIDFFGKTQGAKNLVLARIIFSQSPSGRIAQSLAQKTKDDWSIEAEASPALDDFTAVNGRKVGEFTISCSGKNCAPRDIKHVASNWIVHRAKIIERKFVSTTPVEIWGGNTFTFIATPSLTGSPCGILVSGASVKVRVEYSEKD